MHVLTLFRPHVLTLSQRSINLPVQERTGPWHSWNVRQMRRIHNQRPRTHRVSRVTNNQRVVPWVSGNGSGSLQIACVTIEHNTDDAILDRGAERADRAGHDGCALAVATGCDDGVGALGRCQAEEALRFADRCRGRPERQSVGGQVCDVREADALTGYAIGAVGRLECVAGCWAD